MHATEPLATATEPLLIWAALYCVIYAILRCARALND